MSQRTCPCHRHAMLCIPISTFIFKTMAKQAPHPISPLTIHSLVHRFTHAQSESTPSQRQTDHDLAGYSACNSARLWSTSSTLLTMVTCCPSAPQTKPFPYPLICSLSQLSISSIHSSIRYSPTSLSFLSLHLRFLAQSRHSFQSCQLITFVDPLHYTLA